MSRYAACMLALALLLTACGAAPASETTPATAAPTTIPTQITEPTEPTEPEIPVLYLKETEISYHEDGTVGYSYTYVYDDQGRELSRDWYASGTGETTRYENHYDDQGRLLGYTIFRQDGSEERVEQFIYHDDQGYRERCNPLATMMSDSTYEDREYLDEQGNVIKQESYSNGECIATYTFDSAGKYLWRENSMMKEVYDRDDQGNAVRVVATSKLDGTETVTLYTNTYDDENRLLLTVTNENGEDTQKTEYTYEDSRTTSTITYLKDITYFFLGEEKLLHAAGDTQITIRDYDENGNIIREETLNNGQSDGYTEYTYKALELPGETGF